MGLGGSLGGERCFGVRGQGAGERDSSTLWGRAPALSGRESGRDIRAAVMRWWFSRTGRCPVHGARHGESHGNDILVGGGSNQSLVLLLSCTTRCSWRLEPGGGGRATSGIECGGGLLTGRCLMPGEPIAVTTGGGGGILVFLLWYTAIAYHWRCGAR